MGSPRSVVSHDVNCQPLTLAPEDDSTRTLTVRSDLSKFVKVTCYLYCSLTAIRFIIEKIDLPHPRGCCTFFFTETMKNWSVKHAKADFQASVSSLIDLSKDSEHVATMRGSKIRFDARWLKSHVFLSWFERFPVCKLLLQAYYRFVLQRNKWNKS